MFDIILSNIVHDGLQSLATGRRMQFDPNPLFKSAQMDTQAKARLRRNVTMFMNGSKYKNIMKQLEKEFMLALMK